MTGRRSFLTLMAIGMLAGAPKLAAQTPASPQHPRAEWRHGSDRWAGRGEWRERRGMRCGHHRAWLERRAVHRFRRWERGGHFARRHWHRHWDGII
jgi:hypothetical protein